MTKGKLPEQITEWIEGWFSTDYRILHAWLTNEGNYLLTVQQYDKLTFVTCEVQKNKKEYDISVNTSVRIKDVPIENVTEKR